MSARPLFALTLDLGPVLDKPASEAAMILRDVADQLEQGALEGACVDENGLSVGTYRLWGAP